LVLFVVDGGCPGLAAALAFSCILGDLFSLPLRAGACLGLPVALASPCILIGLFALPLCGAALTFFAAAKKVSKESGSPRQHVGVRLA
jgi:hypothetical protein